MRIALLELDYHFEVLNNTLALLADSPVEVSVFTKKRWYDLLEESRYPGVRWYLAEEDETSQALLTRNWVAFRDVDVVLFSTLNHEYRFFSTRFFSEVIKKSGCHAPLVLRVHNANMYCASLKSYRPFGDLFYLTRDVSKFIKEGLMERDWVHRDRFLRQVDYLTFPDGSIHHYVQSSGLLGGREALPPLPMIFHSPGFHKASRTPFVQVTVTGNVDYRRKDYAALYQALQIAAPLFRRPVRLTFLGKPIGGFGGNTLRRFEELELPNFEFECHFQRVPQEKFDGTLKTTDFLLLPIASRTKRGIYPEFYGYTKISGGINDLIRYGKPALLPASYPVLEGLKAITDTYEGAPDLARKLVAWVNEGIFVEKRRRVEGAMAPFRLEAAQKELIRILESAATKGSSRRAR